MLGTTRNKRNLSPRRRMVEARSKFMLDKRLVFYSIFLYKMRLVEGGTVSGTMQTNGLELRYDPEFVSKLSDAELLGVILHECTHVVLKHPIRNAGRDIRKWHYATDIVVNNLLHEMLNEGHGSSSSNFTWQLPDPHIHAPEFGGASVDVVYANLRGGGEGDGKDGDKFKAPSKVWVTGKPDGLGDDKGDGHGHNDGPGHCGGVIQLKNEDGSELTEAQRIEMELEINSRIAEAAVTAKMQGNLPLCLERLIGEILEPKVAWQEYLRQFVEIHSRDDYNFSRPNRKFLGQGIILPSLHSLKIETIAIAIDSSGSVSQEELTQFLSEVSGILEAFQIGTAYVIYCDHAVGKVDEFSSDDLPLVGVKPSGGGGTSFIPPFRWLEENGIVPTVMVYLTDGECTSFPEDPEFPMMWITTGEEDEHFPFGGVIKIKL